MRFTLFMPLAALVLVSQPLAAADEPLVACVYKLTRKVPREDMSALVRSGYQPKSTKEKTAMATVGESVGNCRSQNGWGQKRQDAAVRYLTGRVLREDALYQGKAMGMTAAMLDGLVASLDPAGRTGYGSGQITPAMNATTATQLQAGGIKLEGMTPEDRQKLGALVSQGITGTLFEQDGMEQFKH